MAREDFEDAVERHMRLQRARHRLTDLEQRRQPPGLAGVRARARRLGHEGSIMRRHYCRVTIIARHYCRFSISVVRWENLLTPYNFVGVL